ncbi:MAG: PD-(D/E)XK nuclease family protein [Candidatus Omnitrophota bacterium]
MTAPALTHFSFSGISSFKTCPRSFEFKYIRQLPEAFSSIEAYMGSTVHQALEWAYDQRRQGTEPSLPLTLEQYERFWHQGDFETIKIVKDTTTRDDYYHQGRAFVSAYFHRVFFEDRSFTLHLEHEFEFPLRDDIVFRGVIDRIALHSDGTLRITDYKTGKVDHPLSTLQLPSYALYLFLNRSEAEIELCYEHLKENRAIVVRFSREEAQKVREDLLREIDTILNTSPDAFVAKPSMLCLWCGYNAMCDASRESATGKAASPDAYLEACPLCGGQLQERKGKFGAFLGCRNYPRCKFTQNLGVNERNAAADPNIDGTQVCPECGGLLKPHKGKFGSFLGCANYPECRFTRPVS